MSENALVPAAGGKLSYTQEQIALIKRQIMPKDSTNDELAMFLAQCERTNLDPFAKQINAIRRGGKLSIEPSIDGFRVVSQRTGKYVGMLGPFWCGPDGEWKDIWLSQTPPAAAKVGVLHADFKEPVWGTALYREYQVPSNAMWRSMPSNQLALCAERKARRIAFPNELGGLYGSEEMEQVDRGPVPTEAEIVVPSAPQTPPEQLSARGQTTEEHLDAAAVNRNSSVAQYTHCSDCGAEIKQFPSESKDFPGRLYWQCEGARFEYLDAVKNGVSVAKAKAQIKNHFGGGSRLWAETWPKKGGDAPEMPVYDSGKPGLSDSHGLPVARAASTAPAPTCRCGHTRLEHLSGRRGPGTDPCRLCDCTAFHEPDSQGAAPKKSIKEQLEDIEKDTAARLKAERVAELSQGFNEATRR